MLLYEGGKAMPFDEEAMPVGGAGAARTVAARSATTRRSPSATAPKRP